MSAKPSSNRKKKNSTGKSSSRRKSGKKDSDTRSSGKWIELLFLLLLFTSIFLTIALIGFNPDDNTSWLGPIGLGPVGVGFASICAISTFGRFGSLAVPALIFLIIIWWVTGRGFRIRRWVVAILAVGFFTGFLTAVVRSWIFTMDPDFIHSGIGPTILAEQSLTYLLPFGTILLSLAVLLGLAVVLINVRPSRIMSGTYLFLTRIFESKSLPVDASDRTVDIDEEFPEVLDDEVSAAVSEKVDESEVFAGDEGAVMKKIGPRELPPLKLLDLPPPDRPEVDDAELEDNARRLEEKLASMRITARVLKTNPGPIITRYDLEPAADVKIARIVSLTDDIAMALKARGVRILAPIPGEAAVGVEIPNSQSQMVYIREIIGSDSFRNARAPLTIALGKDTNGNIFCTDLAKMPHLLIAGATGSGKSVCMNCIITSLLYRCDPRDVKLVMIDPKKIELSLYSRLSEQHLVSPPGLGEDVITTPENAVKTLQSIHMEMEHRYTALADAGVRNINEYNRWVDKITADEMMDSGESVEPVDERERMPYLVIIIDELADLMMTLRREFEDLVVRLAQMARAVGIHLVVATQRPSVDVVTGLIKANFQARIAFRVATRVDSRTIIDSMGAESLLGRGDMLFMGLGGIRLKRLHGALVTTEEVEQVVEFVRAQPPCDSKFKLPDPELQRIQISVGGVGGVDSSGHPDADELFEEAARIVVRTEQGSVSVLQRRLRVGYARAARLIDQLEQAGIVGAFDGSKARQVLVTAEELYERFGISQ